MKSELENLFGDRDPEVMLRIAVAYGACLAIILGLFLCGFWWVGSGVYHWLSPSKAIELAHLPNGPLQAWTVRKDVPFIAISQAGFKYIHDQNTRSVMEKDMASRELFEATPLKWHTRYMPKLRVVGNLWSAFTLTDGDMEEVAVQLINDDGTLGEYGLLPWNQYAEDIRSQYK